MWRRGRDCRQEQYCSREDQLKTLDVLKKQKSSLLLQQPKPTQLHLTNAVHFKNISLRLKLHLKNKWKTSHFLFNNYNNTTFFFIVITAATTTMLLWLLLWVNFKKKTARTTFNNVFNLCLKIFILFIRTFSKSLIKSKVNQWVDKISGEGGEEDKLKLI